MLAIMGRHAEYGFDRIGNHILNLHFETGDKICYCFGASDGSSYTTLRGLTVGGWYADEINLQHRSFVEEALRRTIVSRDRKHFWTLNPESPNHYIYKEYLDKYEAENLPGFHLWKFHLEDNLANTPERIAELRMQYAGVFYRRYILGERCVAEGVIFDMLTDENWYTDATRPLGLEYLSQRFVGIDHGTKHPCGMLDAYLTDDCLYIDREYYWDSDAEHRRKVDTEYVDDYFTFVERQTEFYPTTIIDPEAAPFIEAMKQAGVMVTLAKKDVLSSISHVSTLFKKRTLRINKDRCPMLVKELAGYAWDEKAALHGEEKPIKIHDDLIDPLRYIVETGVPAWRFGEAA